MHRITVVPLLASLGVCFALPSVNGIKAIVPTSAGQIGINPVVLSEYLGTNTQYFSYVSSTASWIGVDSVIIETITMTVNNAPATTTMSALIVVSTATADADGNHVGDISFIVTPAGEKELEGVFQNATNSCLNSKHKRQAGGRVVPAAGGLPCEVQYMADQITARAGILADVDDGGATWKSPGAGIVGAVGTNFLLGASAPVFEGLPLAAAVGGLAYEANYFYGGGNSNTYRFKVIEIELPSQGRATTTAEALPPYFTNFIAEQPNTVPFDPALASSLAAYWQSYFNAHIVPSVVNPSTPAQTTAAPAPTNSAIKTTCATTGPSFNRTDILTKANDFCTNAINQGWSSTPLGGIDSTNNNPFSKGSQSQIFEDVTPDQKDYALQFKVQVLVSGEACNPGSPVALNFVALGQDKCVWDLMNAVDGCTPSTKGGTTLADCAQWDVTSVQGLG